MTDFVDIESNSDHGDCNSDSESLRKQETQSDVPGIAKSGWVGKDDSNNYGLMDKMMLLDTFHHRIQLVYDT